MIIALLPYNLSRNIDVFTIKNIWRVVLTESFFVCYEWSSVEMKAYFTHQAISHAFCNTVNMLHLSHFSILDRLQHLCCPCLKDARVPSHIHVDSHTHTHAHKHSVHAEWELTYAVLILIRAAHKHSNTSTQTHIIN